MIDFHKLTISSLRHMYRKGSKRPPEVMEELFDYIQNSPSNAINAFVDVFQEESLNAARALDPLKMDELPLWGIPIALKDNIDIQGHETTNCSYFYNRTAKTDSVIAERLRAAGAIIFAKCNMHELAYGGTGDRSRFGPVRNPIDLRHMAGGSSSGSAAAVAAGFSVVSVGSDTGGSIRIPSACCGVVGFKPTFDSISRRGTKALCPSLDHFGPIAKTVADCETVYKVLSGQEVYETRNITRRKARVGIPNSFFFDVIAPSIKANYEEFLDLVAPNAVSVENFNWENISSLQDIIMRHEAWDELGDVLANENVSCHQELFLRIYSGSTVTFKEYEDAISAIESISKEFQSIFSKVDVLIIPTLCMEPPLLDQREVDIAGNVIPVRELNKLTKLFNVLKCPAINLPFHGKSSHFPTGIQIVANKGCDDFLLAYAKEIEAKLSTKN